MIKAEKKSNIINKELENITIRYYYKDFIKKNFPKAEIIEVDHHLSHAAGAYFKSPWEHALILTVDGAGNFLSSIVAEGREGKIEIKDKSYIPNSLGTFWGSITKVCGFKSGTRHGGKVTGLAARGNPDLLIDKMRKIIWCEGLRIRSKQEYFFDSDVLVPDWGSYDPKLLKEYLGEASREDIAAAAQKRLEEVTVEIVRNARKIIRSDKIVMAGGVFANVLLNQKILEMPEIDDIFVFPAMSDGGLALGAALYHLSSLKSAQGDRLSSEPLGMVYFGPDYSGEDIEKELKESKLGYKKMDEPAKTVAKLIHENKIVAFYHGRMEYGPRALGARSIMYAAIEPSVNDWLNKRLRRSEFMPFAPVTMLENIKENYKGIKADPLAAKYMTVTYDCTDIMKKNSPACVHVDGTARPQVIKRQDNEYYYDIVSEYYRLSGIPTVINTSFNMHEEPIVESPADAIRAFLDAELDYLVMEEYLVGFEENKENQRNV
jgi:carbamoyltransferase